ncbi:transmembrane and ubiquitin-like domain-containing protein 1 [Eleutherodactylus coqui]|uniref:transmembrane and ubiquitin-like domain-containing protein 1 n=1 Tax=Eleutherodactylus coqui TaxID=57060 RepID=UPI00346380C7
MALIEGVGDEVTILCALLLLFSVIVLAWISTHISERGPAQWSSQAYGEQNTSARPGSEPEPEQTVSNGDQHCSSDEPISEGRTSVTHADGNSSVSPDSSPILGEPSLRNDSTCSDHKPPSGPESPASSDHKPPTSPESPASSDHKPPTSPESPASSDHKPLISAESPASSDHEPLISAESPASSDHEPPTSPESPASSDHKPLISAESPASSDHEPLISAESPASSDHEPAASPESPASSDHEPVASPKSPASSDQEPPASSESPDNGESPTLRHRGPQTQSNSACSQDTITIRLKFLNETERVVNARLTDSVLHIKRSQFPGQEPRVRLIYQGQLLRDDSKTLASLQLTDGCVLHCHLSQHATASGPGGPELSQDSVNVGSLMVPLFLLLLGLLWYCQFQYPQAFNGTATACLGALTLFVLVLVFSSYRR